MIVDTELVLSRNQLIKGNDHSNPIDFHQKSELDLSQKLLIQVQPVSAEFEFPKALLQVQIEGADDLEFDKNVVTLNKTPWQTLQNWAQKPEFLTWPKGQTKRFIRLAYRFDGQTSSALVTAFILKDSPNPLDVQFAGSEVH